MKRYSLEQLKKKIKQIEDYLGPRVGYTSDRWPAYPPYKWLMEYLHLLKEGYYRSLRKKR